MTLVTESELRSKLRRPERGMTLRLPAGTSFSPAAKDFLQQWDIDVSYDDAPPGGRPHGAHGGPIPDGNGSLWNRPGSFPVSLSGPAPCCSTCGSPVSAKGDSLTQLDATTFTAKDHPRIRLRGRLDSLHALFLLSADAARTANRQRVADLVSTLAAYCREIVSAEYHARDVAPLMLDDLDDDALHAASHDPQTAFGVAHLVPDTVTDPLVHQLNYLRCQVREVELDMVAAFGPQPRTQERSSLLHAANRLSSAVYVVELLLAAGRCDTKDVQ